MKITFKTELTRYGVLGYCDFTWSIQRSWKGDTRNHPTWRHITLGLRSPIVRQPRHLFADKRARYTWHRMRFGHGCGNLYLGFVFILTTFGRSYPPLAYRKFGPFEWARQPRH